MLDISSFIFWFIIFWFYHGYSITLCYHRCLSHRSAKLNKWLEYLLVWGAYTAFQSGPIPWVSTHRVHHQSSDRPGDPHSPKYKGFWGAWIGWVTYRQVDKERCNILTQDLREDPLYRWLGDGPMPTKVWQCFTWCILHRVILFLLFGKEVALASALAGFIIFCAPNFINTICHLKVPGAYRRFKTMDNSQNVWWLVPFTFGEAYHQNHHYSPRRASVSHTWWEIDITYLFLLVLEKLKLAKDIRR